MGLLVASLLLPYTVSFDDECDSASANSKVEPQPIPDRSTTKSLATAMPNDKEIISTSPIPDLMTTMAPLRPPITRSNSRVNSSEVPGGSLTSTEQLFLKGNEDIKETLHQASISKPAVVQSVVQSVAKSTANKSSASKTSAVASGSITPEDPSSSAPALDRRPHNAHNLNRSALNLPLKAKNSAPIREVVEPRLQVSSPLYPRVKTERRRTISLGTSSSASNAAELLDNASWSLEEQTGGNGGLRNAVRRAQAIDPELEVKWVGTLGILTDDFTEHKKLEVASKMTESPYNSVPVFVDDTTFEGHYSHYCKHILWPTFHYEIPDNPKSKAYEDHSWEHYKALNQAVADTIVSTYQDGDIIWVNDYHLLLVCAMVREKLPSARIMFFLHIPFPSSEVFRCFASRDQLLKGILGANCVGFQIPEYSRHFLQTCNRLLLADAEVNGIWIDDRFVSVISSSIGIDPLSLDEWLKTDEVTAWRTLLREKWDYDTKLIVSRDKLDGIRGVKQKLLAYEEFLKRHPELIGKVVLVQVCLSDAGESSDLEMEVTSIVDRINVLRKDFACHIPVMFLQQDIDFVQYLALLSEADVFAVTSLREGMNLTCHEFIYCNSGKMGPLVLSEFTGSASVLDQHCLLVNPWDKIEVAEAFYKSITLDEDTRKANWQALNDYVSHHTCLEWFNDLLMHLEDAWSEDQERQANKSHRLLAGKFISKYKKTKDQPKNHRVFFFDFDTSSGASANALAASSAANGRTQTNSLTALPGLLRSLSTANLEETSDSLKNKPSPVIFEHGAITTSGGSPIRGSPAGGIGGIGGGGVAAAKNTSTHVSTQRKILALSELIADPSNIVYLMSRDRKEVLERTFNRVGNIGLIAENGAFMRPVGSNTWLSYADEQRSKEWKEMVIQVLQSFAERTPGTVIETLDTSINFYVKSLLEQDPDRANTVIGECINHINDAFSAQHIRARFTDGSRIVISDQNLQIVEAAKKAFALAIEETDDKVGFLCVATESGEDVDDIAKLIDWAHDEMSHIPTVYTVSMGARATSAKWSLGGLNSLLNIILGATRNKA